MRLMLQAEMKKNDFFVKKALTMRYESVEYASPSSGKAD